MMNMTVATVISILNSGARKKIDPRDLKLYQETLRNYEAIGPAKFSPVDQRNAETVRTKLEQIKADQPPGE
ncbi:MAG: hypothetical protein BGO39_08375 [Chloroflexi bacterium 54-19]|nr:MAG: hypothetical protein BGO39_08375 [Chloroflexi bacterium 54-19]